MINNNSDIETEIIWPTPLFDSVKSSNLVGMKQIKIFIKKNPFNSFRFLKRNIKKIINPPFEGVETWTRGHKKPPNWDCRERERETHDQLKGDQIGFYDVSVLPVLGQPIWFD